MINDYYPVRFYDIKKMKNYKHNWIDPIDCKKIQSQNRMHKCSFRFYYTVYFFSFCSGVF